MRRNQAQTETIQHQKEDSKHSDHPAQLNIASTSTILPNAEASPRNRCLKATSGTSKADQDMADPTSPPGLNQVRPNTRAETPLAIAHPQAEQPNFGYRMATPHQTHLSAANANPFTALEALSPEAEGPKDAQGKLGEIWTFQASKKQSSMIVLPRQTLPQSPAPTSIHDLTPGSGRKRTRSEVHNSFFTSLGIPVPPGQEHARAIVWPVLSRERNNQKEILVNVKSNDSPSLSLHLRCTGTPEEEWTPESALADLTRNVEAELEGKILRFSLNLKGRLALEWSWQEDHVKGGWECTILAHVSTGFSAISAQKKKNLHWRTLESSHNMNNDVVFSGPAHNLLLKTGPASTNRQTHKSTSASLLASPQAARKKKRYIKLDLLALAPQDLASSLQNEYDGLGSIGSPAAQGQQGNA